MNKPLVRLAVAILISLVLHWLVLRNWTPAEKNQQNAAAGGAQAMKIKIQEPVQEPAPQAAPVEVPKNEAQAENQQTTSNDPDLEENDGTPPPSDPSEVPPVKDAETEPPQEAAAAEAAPKGVNLESNKEKAAISKAPDTKSDSKKSAKEQFNDKINDLKKDNKEIIQSQLSQNEYNNYIRSLKIGKMKGIKVPKLEIIYSDLQDIFALHRNYRIKVLAFDVKTVNKTWDVVEIQNLGTSDITYQYIKKFDFNKYSSRMVTRTGPYFDTQRKKIEANGLLPGSLRLYSVTPASVDNYFRYKQNEVIKRNGYKPDDVVMTLCRGHKTSFGGYILKVESLVLRDQRTVDVKDFEYAKPTGVN